MPDTEDERLCVARAVRGEPGAFARLYQRHVDAVFNYVYFRVRDEATAEDLTQDVFINAYKAMTQLKDHDRFKHWILRIAHNRVLNHWRALASRADSSAMPLDPAHPPRRLPAVDDAAIARAESRASAEDLVAAIGRLTELQQQVVALRFVAGLSVAETAEVMQRSVGAVKNLQHHALCALRRSVPPPDGFSET